MTEYIEREAISEEIRKFYYKNPPNFSYGEGFDRGLDRAQRAILDAPAADVAEVVHAKWIPFHSEAAGDIQYCSACDIGFDARMDYCPHCGARMDGWMEDADNGE